MGLGRALWRSTTWGRLIDTARNIKDEGSITDGCIKTQKENWTEDNPIGKLIYTSGKYDGKKEGYAEASDVYEKKLIHQAEEFIIQKRDFEREHDDYEALLDEYETELDRLSEKINKTEAEKEYLLQLLLMDRKLRKMAD